MDHAYLRDNLIGANVDLEFGGRLEEFPYTGEFPDCRQKATMDFIEAVFFRSRQHHGTFVEPLGRVKLAVLDSQPADTNPVHSMIKFFVLDGLLS